MLQKRLSRMLDISNCDVIYCVIYVICSHYVGKAISPLFAWRSSYAITVLKEIIVELLHLGFHFPCKLGPYCSNFMLLH